MQGDDSLVWESVRHPKFSFVANVSLRRAGMQQLDVEIKARKGLVRLCGSPGKRAFSDQAWAGWSVATSTPHQPANAGFAPGLRLNVGECG